MVKIESQIGIRYPGMAARHVPVVIKQRPVRLKCDINMLIYNYIQVMVSIELSGADQLCQASNGRSPEGGSLGNSPS
jgi:hypothetical protein